MSLALPNSANKAPSKPFRILSLDGGGVRAVLQAVIISRLAEEFPEFLAQVDMFTGVSAGSIVALALANGLTPDQTQKMWEDQVTKVFTQGFINRISTLDNAIGSSYRNDDLKTMLHETLGDKKLADLEKKILIPSFNLDRKPINETDSQNHRRWAPEFFHNFPRSTNLDAPLVDVCLRSTAAPTFFPIYQGYIDGGTYANCPALVAVTTAIKSGVKAEDIVVLSISTGNNPQFISQDQFGTGNWGLLEWGPKIVDVLLDANTQSINYQCDCLLDKRYRRIDPVLHTEIGLDQASAVPALEQIAAQIDLTATVDWLKEYWIRPSDHPKYYFDESGAILDTPSKHPQGDHPKSDADANNNNNNAAPSSWGCSIQ